MDLTGRLALTRTRTAVRRRVLRHRRLLAALLVAGAAVTGVRALAPPAPPSTPVLVAARDLPAGQVLGRGDLTTTRLAPQDRPAGAVEPAGAPLGHALAAPLRRGEPLTDVRLVGPGLAAGQPADTVAAPVRLADAGQAALLAAGDVVDLLATDPQGGGPSTVLARAAVVLAVPARSDSDDGALPGRLVVLALRSGDVYHVTAASVVGYVTYTWSRG
ncbi:pilus assembly protein CpaB [Pimelobacter simplex]|uniref:Pilus assembly protein CpaB n=1 Tax=Nocardioides simplex TaxID=2045 RepID=A0A7J5DTV4_NOCSI|nr:SAF domain-containing protein [Pimelobacter simplex]KAB2808501.1 pilus assembly protein CpaB [Pimelobacter simplex]